MILKLFAKTKEYAKKKIEKREGKGLLKSLINGIGTRKVFMIKVLEATLRKEKKG
jgi:hypothetical protein